MVATFSLKKINKSALATVRPYSSTGGWNGEMWAAELRWPWLHVWDILLCLTRRPSEPPIVVSRRPSQLHGLIDRLWADAVPDSNKERALGKSKAIIDGQQSTNQTISKLIPYSLTVLAFFLVCIYIANSWLQWKLFPPAQLYLSEGIKLKNKRYWKWLAISFLS